MKRFAGWFVVVAAVSATAWAASRGLAQPRDASGAPAGAGGIRLDDAKRDKLLSAKRAYEMLPALERQRGGPSARFELEDRCTWSRRWMEAASGCASGNAERVRAAEAHLVRMKLLLGVGERMHQAGDLLASDVSVIRYFVDEAAQSVAEARQRDLAA